MKKNLLTISILTICSFFLLQAYASKSQVFINKFASCSKYTINDGKQIAIIMGWANRKCYYKEMASKKTIECGFRQSQLNEMAQEMRKNKQKEYPSIDSLMSFKKFLLLEGVCTVDSGEEQ